MRGFIIKDYLSFHMLFELKVIHKLGINLRTYIAVA